MWTCPNCNEQIPDSKETCAICGFPRKSHTNNYCINPKCQSYKIELDDMRKICSVCGELTNVGKQIEELT